MFFLFDRSNTKGRLFSTLLLIKQMEFKKKKYFRTNEQHGGRDVVPILRFGANNNLLQFKRAIIVKAAKSLELMVYYATPDVDQT